MSRSEKYPTHYRIGVLAGKDVYYNLQEGLAVKRDGRLVEMTVGELEVWHREEVRELYPYRYSNTAEIGPDYSERPSCVTRNVRLGMEEW